MSKLNSKLFTLLAVAPVLVALLSATHFAEPLSAGPSGTSAVGSCSVTGMLAEYADWVNMTPGGGTNVVRVSLASNQNNRLVSYSEGILEKTGGEFPTAAGSPDGGKGVWLGGTLTQYFSDRKYALPATGAGLNLNQYPFSPQKTDQLSLGIYTPTGQIGLRLMSWGGTALSLTGVQCGGGVLYGFTNTNPASMFVISLSKEFKANPPSPK